MAEEQEKEQVLRVLESVELSLDILDDWTREFRQRLGRYDAGDIEILHKVEGGLVDTIRYLQTAKD